MENPKVKATGKGKTTRQAVAAGGVINAQVPGEAPKRRKLDPAMVAARNKKISETRKRNSEARKKLLITAKAANITGDMSVFETAGIIAEQLNNFSWSAKPQKEQIAAISHLKDVAERFVKFFGK